MLTIVDEPIEQEEMVPGTHSSLDLNHRKTSVAALADFEAEPAGGPASDAALGAGDMDADLVRAASSGDETPGGDNPTPDQDVVDLIGRSLGVEYDDDEELEGAEKIARRDRHRWELDPASSEDYRDRGR